MKLNAIVFILIAMPLAMSTSCKKGDIGPQGDPGTANVIYSPWFTPNAYKKDTVFGSWGFSFDQSAPALTQQVLDSGTVLTFGKLLGYNAAVWNASQISQLPINITYNQGGFTTDTWTAFARPGTLRIRFVNDRNIYTSISTQHQFRYIVIPGGQRTGRNAALSYAEVCRRYGIEE